MSEATKHIQHTPGPWRVGAYGTTVMTDRPNSQANDTICSLYRMVEATWATAYGKASGVNAGQRAINRAGKILNDSEGILWEGKIEVRTKPEGDKQ